MAAPRSTSLRALRILSQQHTAAPSIRRGLCITSAKEAQTANISDRSSLYTARSLPDLKSECQRRSLTSNGSHSELVERLANHDFLQSRAFSIAMRRINGSSTSQNTGRQFNTSRAQKAVNDSSTVDFAYLPSMADIDAPAPRADPRIPIPPDAYTHHDSAHFSSLPMKPQVYTVSGEGADVSASPMTEVVDNHAVDIDPFSLTETVGKSRFGEEIQRHRNGSNERGVVRELWTEMLDDLIGSKQPSQRKH
ncbi:hypothetical protein EYZ11_011218 [Aspergillus tanneri]|uniref:SAP domain-containing protein n=1 Tax=Aspergillus tanneri TaxID=1220188 RepID=A0A4S3J3P6_9EURO|nr:uncharacterized protein ATNIH1004_005032 [Aspergillus tanneri]KAA8649137.1 hypothetical protein ATNIH1004_005032 [Aspergillus tanneri]THC89335.1 hypothetical protein EYZ11_011218 [Aspergillus tanneri]